MTALIKISLVLSLLFTAPVQASCMRTLGLLGTGAVYGFVNFWVMGPLLLPYNAYRSIRRRIPITGRGPIGYYIGLGLADADLADKDILDVGAGYSPFANLVNFWYGGTGTRARAMDSTLPRHLADDAEAMTSVENESIDLLVSNWALTYYFSASPGEREKVIEENNALLDELIRVTRPRGQIRFNVLPALDPESILRNAALQHLARYPRVREARIVSGRGYTAYFRIDLR